MRRQYRSWLGHWRSPIPNLGTISMELNGAQGDSNIVRGPERKGLCSNHLDFDIPPGITLEKKASLSPPLKP